MAFSVPIHVRESKGMRLGIRKEQKCLPNGRVKIGAVARHFGVSVDLLRLYEREGLLIPTKSPRRTRYFTEHDYLWIGTILRLVREARLTLAAVRHVLAQLPCWQIRNCGFTNKANCPVISDLSKPCWANRAMCPVVCSKDCYFCEVYRSAPSCESFKALLGTAMPERPARQTHGISGEIAGG